MIIDGHVHICEPPYTQERASMKTIDGPPFTLPVKRADLSVNLLLHDMDEHQVDKAIVMAFPGILSNKFLSKVAKEHPKRLIGFASVTNPKDENESVRQLKKAVNELGLKGLKLHPDCHSFSPADPEIIPLIQCAADLGIPVLIHLFPGVMIRGYFHHNLPEHIDTLKKHVPEAKIIIAHTGGPRFLDLLTIGQIPGVYVETSWGLTLIAELFGIDFAARFIRIIGIDNIIFGSDWCGTPHNETHAQLSLIQKMNLRNEEKKKILGGNIMRVLGIQSQ